MRRRKRMLLGGAGLLIALAGVMILVVGVIAFSQAEEGVSADTTATTDITDLESIGTGGVAKTTGAPAQVSGEPFRTCEGCHPDYLEKPDDTGDLIFDHQIHLDNSVDCVTCHEPPLGHFATPAPMMMACLSCHEGETAPNECANCHRKLEEIAPGLGEGAVHLAPDAKTRSSCGKCHDVEVWCEQCHGLVMPHPTTWYSQHGPVALDDSEICVKCHQSQDKTFCISCHEVQMPHPAYWYSSHGDIAAENPDSCARCHPGGEQFCNECHHAGFQPTPKWSGAQHGAAVTKQGDTECLVCHEETFCTDCHAQGGVTVQ